MNFMKNQCAILLPKEKVYIRIVVIILCGYNTKFA